MICLHNLNKLTLLTLGKEVLLYSYSSYSISSKVSFASQHTDISVYPKHCQLKLSWLMAKPQAHLLSFCVACLLKWGQNRTTNPLETPSMKAGSVSCKNWMRGEWSSMRLGVSSREPSLRIIQDMVRSSDFIINSKGFTAEVSSQEKRILI